MQYEYQILELKLQKKDDRLVELVKALNQFGQDGWRLHEFQVDAHRSIGERTVRLLLERAVDSTST